MVKIETVAFLSVQEDLPPESDENGNPLFYFCYSSVFGQYYIARWSSVRGWLDQDGDHLKAITHFLDQKVPMPFPILNELDIEEAKKYGFGSRHGILCD